MIVFFMSPSVFSPKSEQTKEYERFRQKSIQNGRRVSAPTLARWTVGWVFSPSPLLFISSANNRQVRYEGKESEDTERGIGILGTKT